MLKIDHKTAQAATELAVFGAILIFLLGTIVRTAVGNGLTQDQNFNAMRMAMLSSWNDSKTSNPSHNSASVLIVEDRLSPDFNKYGDIDRNPYVSSSSGSFTYEMEYPVGQAEVNAYLPIMDVYINGQHFPFTTAAFVQNRQLTPNNPCGGGPYENYPLTQAQCLSNQCLRSNREWVQLGGTQYKLFYSLVANGAAPYVMLAPDCCPDLNTVVCKDKALCKQVGSLLAAPNPSANTNGDMEFDLLRNGNYAEVDAKFPITTCPADGSSVSSGNIMRCNVAWQWSATVASVQGNTNDGADPMIGLDPDNDQFPNYDIDGRLKMVTIYAFSLGPATCPASPIQYPTVSYEDYQGGDIDATWDINTCGPKPGLQNDSEIYSFTGNGTFLQIRDGQLYNPETGQVVNSINKRNNIDLIQRTIQLSNNTYRFCDQGGNPQPCVLNAGQTVCAPTNDPNPVEACSTNCFTGATIAETCYDTSQNIIYVRSRLEDRRGRYWMTNASGQLKIQ